MPTIYDNVEARLLEGLRKLLPTAKHCAFCVGYFNLRGWSHLADLVDGLPGGPEERACRLLIGMHHPPEEEMRALQRAKPSGDAVDGPTLARLRRRVVEGFREQIAFGVPTNEAEQTLRRLAAQLRARKVYLKAFLTYPLHAKLYLIARDDPAAPLVGFVGSSNLTAAGLIKQGELNVDVVEQDAARKLLKWFDERWRDPKATDLTDELAELIETSWARTTPIKPYHVYLNIARHLSEDAREGERMFTLPAVFRGRLLDFQAAAVRHAARILHRRGGVLLGDVVGLGKTLMATAIARLFQDDDASNTLVICPPKLSAMWEAYLHEYGVVGRIFSLGNVVKLLPELPRYRLVVVDESHNLRSRAGRRYHAIADYIGRNESRVLLLTATPYNKHFSDLSGQLRLFVDDREDLHVRPERFFQRWAAEGKTEADFVAQYQTSPRSLRAFEQSDDPEDWRDLMRLFLIRRTRRFILQHYAEFDPERERHFVWLDGRRAYCPQRRPKCLTFPVDPTNPDDVYARMFDETMVALIENLKLPRYGLAAYLTSDAEQQASPEERAVLRNLSRAGRRLLGFCRTNLFKRLESSGHSFLLSIKRHLQRNRVALYALENNLPLPIGAQDAALLDASVADADPELLSGSAPADGVDDAEAEAAAADVAATYRHYRQKLRRRFDWLPARCFRPDLAAALRADSDALQKALDRVGAWKPEHDAKLGALLALLRDHPEEKTLIFTQFADTAAYLHERLVAQGVADAALATYGTPDAVALARRFSPTTNGGLRKGETPLRVLVATDALSEGQNLQDARMLVNYDLPWAIIRLIQRAGRIDRIGQQHDTLLLYSFLPADGVERVIRLRRRLSERLAQNAEIVGSDETFFGEEGAARLRDLYTEQAAALDDPPDDDIDLGSVALQVWNSATAADREAAQRLPPIAAAARAHAATPESPAGVIAYVKFPDGADALIRVDADGRLASQSLTATFRAAACAPDTPPVERAAGHHDLVRQCVALAAAAQTDFSGRLGSLRSARRKLWERLKKYPAQLPADEAAALQEALDLIWRFPLTPGAREAASRRLRLGADDRALIDLVLHWAREKKLCEARAGDDESDRHAEPQLICSLGLAAE